MHLARRVSRSPESEAESKADQPTELIQYFLRSFVVDQTDNRCLARTRTPPWDRMYPRIRLVFGVRVRIRAETTEAETSRKTALLELSRFLQKYA